MADTSVDLGQDHMGGNTLAGGLSVDNKRLLLAGLACARTGSLWSSNRCVSIILPMPACHPLPHPNALLLGAFRRACSPTGPPLSLYLGCG